MTEENNLVFKFIPGLRRNSSLLVIESEKQIYRQKHKYSDRTRYVCYEKNCNVSLIFYNDDNKCQKIDRNVMHHHTNQEELIKKMFLMNAIKTECKKATLKRSACREIFDDKCLENKDSAHLVQYGKMARNMFRIKNEVLPKNPTCPQDIQKMFKNPVIQTKFGKSKSAQNEDFYKDTIIEHNFSYTIFMSPTITKIITTSMQIKQKHYILDGTFSIVPSCGYKQLLIIYIQYQNHVSIYIYLYNFFLRGIMSFCFVLFYLQIFPFLYVLLSNKSQIAYQHLFNYINNNLMKFEANSFIIDYEKALRNALKLTFPSANIKGCWFHYCQALYRNSKKFKNFSKIMKSCGKFKQTFRKFMSLPLLKPVHIFEAFEELKIQFHAIRSTQNADVIQNFLNYFEKQWIIKEGPKSFSVYKQHIRTTSAAESFNSMLTSKIPKNGNFCKFLDVILNVDFKETIELQNALEGVYNVFQNPKSTYYKKKSILIEKSISKLDKGIISLTDFLNEITNKNNKIITDNNDDDNDDDSNMSNDEDEIDDNHSVEETANEDTMLCIICYANPRNTLLQPCNHLKICSGCYKTICENAMKINTELENKILCPYCKQIVMNSIKIFI